MNSAPPSQEPTKKKHIMGSMTRLYHSEHIIINPVTGERVIDILKQDTVRQEILCERDAEKIIRSLREKCVGKQMYLPSDEELATALDALQVLWFLLPTIERHKGESNKTYFFRTLDEVDKFRGVDMFQKET